MSKRPTALINSRLFDGETFHASLGVVIADGRIQQLCPEHELPFDISTIDCQGQWLAPGFVDTQINGSADILFNQDPTSKSIKHISDTQRVYGTTSFLPTLISPSRELITEAKMAIKEASSGLSNGCVGIHIEGPFLNPEKRGVHPRDQIIAFTDEDVALVASSNPLTLITVAPEAVTNKQVSELVKTGCIVSLGHSNACYEQAMQALEAGASGFTHLFNAMSPLTSREPGMVGAALSSTSAWCGIILDGHHIHPQSALIAIKCKPQGKVFYVTDAVHASASLQNEHRLLGQKIITQNGKVSTEEGTLAGSSLTMIGAVKNGIDLLELDIDESLKMASRYPAEFLRIDNEIGFIRPGYRANLITLNDDLEVTHSWINGHHLQH